ncbi:Ldh family oxidoreductase [Phyllobacterium sp. SB3]|uniref:Ldh family oxidoreductase n=1 Tax=Phyllobacterium sp. SB3 TaxID=3156073 RepID=UPI0032AF7993
MSSIGVTAEEIERTALFALIAHGASVANAIPVARAIARAEAEGNSICGLFYLPIFCEHLDCGKVDGRAEPHVAVQAAVIQVDGRSGFAHPTIEVGNTALAVAAQRYGIASMAVRNSYNCLALSHHVTPLAEQGLIGICMSNAPASVAPPGAIRRIFGTNPLAFAIPFAGQPPIVVDQSMSAVTKTEVILRRNRGDPIPLGWAQDKAGNAVTDAAAGLEGSLLPAGGQKGANVALLIEVLAAALTGSALSTQASAFGDNAGGPPGVGQFIIAIDPAHFAGQAFAASIGHLAAAFTEAGVRLPGRTRNRLFEIEVDINLWRKTNALVKSV